MPFKDPAQAAAYRRAYKRNRTAQLRAQRLLNPIDKAVQRENVRAPRDLGDVYRWLEALKEHLSWIGGSMESLRDMATRVDERVSGLQSICEQLADQNALLRDQLGTLRQQTEATDAKVGMAARILLDGAPENGLMTLDSILDNLEGP